MSERERMTRLHGALVVRMVDRMMDFRTDRARAMVAGKFNNDADAPEHLSRYAEATALAALVHAAKFTDLPMNYDAHLGDDMGAYFRLYGLAEGHALTKQDIIDLEAILAELNDEIGNQAEKAHEIRLAAFREIGGDELVKIIEAKDKAQRDRVVAGVMAKFKAELAVKDAE
jgi:hypothetical protein